MANLFGEVWNLVAYSPGNPAFPSEFTDPNAPVGFTVHGDGTDSLAEVPGAQIGAFSATARSLSGHAKGGLGRAAIGGHNDWYVNQIWTDPQPIDFGSIIGSKTVTVNVLSTFRYDERTLEAIDISSLGAGVTITDDPTPLGMPPFSEFSFDLVASAEGDPSIDGDTVLDFDAAVGNIAIATVGRRLILFWYEQEQPINETLGWRTDIIKNRDRNETRDSLRTTPRQRLEVRVVGETDAETASLRALLLAFRPFLFGVPIWFEQRRVTAAVSSGSDTIPVDTVDVDHRVGGTVMFWEPATRTFFDAEIASFTDTQIVLTQAIGTSLSDKALVLPVRFGYIVDGPSYKDRPTGHLETTIVFETNDNVDLSFVDQAALEAEFTVHPEDSLPVLSDRNMMTSNTQGRSQDQRFVVLDGDIGDFEVRPQDDRGDLVSQVNHLSQDNAETRRMRSFLHWLRGSWGSFYLPTFRNDLPPLVDFNLNSTAITIANIGIADLVGLEQPHKSVMLELPDGRQFFAEVQSSTSIDSSQETITLVNPFDASAEAVPAATAKISWLELVRVEGDTATFLHQRVGLSLLRFQVRTIKR